jgi:cobalt/nickel transport system permease protein
MMRADFLDLHSRLASPIHRLPTALKLAVALAVILTTTGTGPVVWAVLAVGLLVVAAVSRVPVGFLARRWLWLAPVGAGLPVVALFPPGGMEKFLALFARSALCLFTMILLAATTPFDELLRVARRARVPAVVVTTLALMYRYVFVLADELRRMRQARASRTFTRSRARWWRSLGTVIGQLFVRSTERAERIYAAMCARGWR